jgi:putative drug exporter of the RND superfamily
VTVRTEATHPTELPLILRWSGFVVRHRLAVGVFWLAIAVVGVFIAPQVSGRLSLGYSIPDAPSYQANQAILRAYGNGAQGYPEVAVITLPRGESVTDPAMQVQMARAFAAVAADPAFRVVSYSNTGDQRFVSADRTATFGLIFVPEYSELDAPPFGPAIKQAMQPALPAGAQLTVTGMGELMAGGSGKATNVGVLSMTLLAGTAALAVLVFVFGSALALVPLLIAGVAILTAFLVVLGLTEFTSVSFVVEYLIALIGLGVAIDYSLLLVTRWREERAQGITGDEAVHRAMATAGRAVVFSGVTVAIGLFALVFVPVPFLRSVGFAGMLIPLISIVVTLSLLPAVLASVGPRIDWPRLRTDKTASRGWTAWSRAVVRFRWLAALAGAGILIALGSSALGMQIGEPRADALASSGSASDGLRAYEQAGFPLGALTPVEVLVPDGADPDVAAARLASVSGVYATVAPAEPAWRREGTAMVDVVPRDETGNQAGLDTLNRVRSTASADMPSAKVGGAGAALLDENSAFYGRFPLIFGAIAVVTLLLLMRAFRSLLLAFKAVVLNVVSVGASYGVVVLVWQHGYGSNLIWGIPATGAITNWAPLMTFAFLFGLSMDYEVFILTRIREVHDRLGSTTQAIVEGLGRTGRLVTSAAFILCLAFVALTASPETDLKVVASGLGAGILLDAFVVRALLVPALISVFGPWSWWLPTWIARLLRTEPSPLRRESARDREESLGESAAA